MLETEQITNPIVERKPGNTTQVGSYSSIVETDRG